MHSFGLRISATAVTLPELRLNLPGAPGRVKGGTAVPAEAR